jgi:hypothetical protein
VTRDEYLNQWYTNYDVFLRADNIGHLLIKATIGPLALPFQIGGEVAQQLPEKFELVATLILAVCEWVLSVINECIRMFIAYGIVPVTTSTPALWILDLILFKEEVQETANQMVVALNNK